MEQQFIDVLHFSDYIMMNYRNSQGQDIDFYVAYYETQRKGELLILRKPVFREAAGPLSNQV